MGDMFKSEVPQNHKDGPESGRGGPVWAETLSNVAPRLRIIFQALPGPETQLKTLKDTTMLKCPVFIACYGILGYAS